MNLAQLLALLALLASVALSVVSVTTLALVPVAVVKRLDPIIRRPWACADCKARYATESEVIEHERLHSYCPCGADRTTNRGHDAACARRAVA